jgi:S-DNA-T family DNA segregation ATPase FtsK/SpoIIIE
VPAPVALVGAPPEEKHPADGAKLPARQLSLEENIEEEEVERTLPPLSLLTDVDDAGRAEDVSSNVEVLEETLSSFGIDARVLEIERGPRVTRYEVQPPPGVRVARITNLADDLALALAALDVRVEAPVPGKGVIGIEVPNRDVVHVGLKGILTSDLVQQHRSKLSFALGKDISGHPRVADLAKMPHLLIAGATNSGKSVCLNAMIVSILFRAYPGEVKFLMVDPKRVELSLFAGIPHLVAPVAHDAREAAGLLRWAIREMEMRYGLFADKGVRNIQAYNEQMEMEGSKPLYYMVIVIDELADLMMQAAAEFEASICRLAQLARATGIHLVVATQRPSVNVITGTIKANIASRIAFAVASQADSRVILDVNGAERLVGSGDMLFLPFDASKPTRIQGAYVAESDIEALVDFLKSQGAPHYLAEVLALEGKGASADDEHIDDEMFEKALDFVLSTNYASASMLQRKLRIGYTRAARMIDMMEERGYIGPADGSRPREVYATPRPTGDSP